MRHIHSTLMLIAIALVGADAAWRRSRTPSVLTKRSATGLTATASRMCLRSAVFQGSERAGDPQDLGSLVPYGKVWRAGADEATLFIRRSRFLLGGAPIAAGAYLCSCCLQATDRRN